jgi:uncharacterized membrane protein (TIGR02234 family)
MLAATSQEPIRVREATRGAQMTAGSPARPAGRQPRRELALLLLLGAAGAGLALLAARQGWARVETAAPRPLPASVTTVTGQALVPAASALALAALAGLAAVLATRRALRRVAAVLVAGLGVGLAVAVGAGISAADVLAAAAAGAPGSSGAAAGSGVGSTTAGTGGPAGPAGSPLSGLSGHVVFVAFPWRPIAFAGALAVVAAGVLAAWRAERLPVMSSRFDPPSWPAGPESAEPAEPAVPAGGRGYQSDSASMWESLSRGEDPTGPE